MKILDHVALCNINKANFRYPDDYSFRLMQALICCAAAEADTQFAIFPWYAPKKQCPIFAICAPYIRYMGTHSSEPFQRVEHFRLRPIL